MFHFSKCRNQGFPQTPQSCLYPEKYNQENNKNRVFEICNQNSEWAAPNKHLEIFPRLCFRQEQPYCLWSLSLGYPFSCQVSHQPSQRGAINLPASAPLQCIGGGKQTEVPNCSRVPWYRWPHYLNKKTYFMQFTIYFITVHLTIIDNTGNSSF